MSGDRWPMVMPDPQDAEDVRDAEIEEHANALRDAASDLEWAEALNDGLTRIFGWNRQRPEQVTRLRAFRKAVECNNAVEALVHLRVALAEEFRARADEELTCR